MTVEEIFIKVIPNIHGLSDDPPNVYDLCDDPLWDDTYMSKICNTLCDDRNNRAQLHERTSDGHELSCFYTCSVEHFVTTLYY